MEIRAVEEKEVVEILPNIVVCLCMGIWSFKKEFFVHLFSSVILASLIIVFRYLHNQPEIIPFVVGIVVGMVLPDVDHFIYALYLRPQDLTSQRVRYKLSEKKFFEVFSLLYSGRDERRDLIFHNFMFLILFEIFTFWVLSSSISSLGRGIVIAFLLHLLVDQIVDLKILKSVTRWLRNLPFSLDIAKIKLIISLQLITLVIFSFVL